MKIIPVDVEKEMKKSYLDYAMSVIIRRALPDVRDGLKPVHRRILYTMYEAGFTSDKPHRKCATTVGDVLGKYHPHGDVAVYDSLVRMAQDFSLRYPLIDGHGNFGSVDGDPPAAYRYTESRMAKISDYMLEDIQKETVNYTLNYDERLKEPTVLPSRFPNLLVNGSSGIAVGMSTYIPPHQLGETIDAVIALIDDPLIGIESLMQYIKGPDFPTGGIIMGKNAIRQAYLTGRGKIVVRSKLDMEPMDENRQRIVVTEIPYQVNKANLILKIAELMKEKKIEGISALRDESDRNGMRIVIELKRDANSNVVINKLYKFTQLQTTLGVILLALVNNEPKILNLKQMLEHYIDFQKEIVTRRTQFDLRKAKARAHILEGLKIAVEHLDDVISVARSSENTAAAKQTLMEKFSLTDIQAQAILDMRLSSLTGLERNKLQKDFDDITAFIKELDFILSDDKNILKIIKDEILLIKEKFNDRRLTEICEISDERRIVFEDMDLIPNNEQVITLTHFGYIKRMEVDNYKAQRRGGRGISALSTREEDFVENLFITYTHNDILFFTNSGRTYRLKAYEIPEASRQAKGIPIINMLELRPNEKITAVIPIKNFKEGEYLFMVTKKGVVKKTSVIQFSKINRSGINSIDLDEEDELINVKLTDGSKNLILVTYKGLALSIRETDVRAMGRTARGVRGIRLREDDFVVGVSRMNEEGELLIVSENGYGKKTRLEEYTIHRRGGKGMIAYKVTEKTGKIADVKVVSNEHDVMLISSDNVIIRIPAKDISTISRNSSGVRLMKVSGDVKVVAIALTKQETEEMEN